MCFLSKSNNTGNFNLFTGLPVVELILKILRIIWSTETNYVTNRNGNLFDNSKINYVLVNIYEQTWTGPRQPVLAESFCEINNLRVIE